MTSSKASFAALSPESNLPRSICVRLWRVRWTKSQTQYKLLGRRVVGVSRLNWGWASRALVVVLVTTRGLVYV